MSEALECAGDRILQLVREAEAKGWCTRPFCTTCGNGELRSRLAAIPDLTEHLIRLNLDEIVSGPSGVDSLTIMMLTQSVDWDQVLEAWMPRASENTRLLDLVLFRVIGRRMPFQRSQPMKAWVKASVERACRSGDESLVESLVYVLGVSGEGLDAYSELVAVARDLSEQS
ncbi:hypothetical protein JXD38_12580 [candidate division WOR-3 bacterium]|nr:hypothetical protein [candidate division WOR-3 bacterium]